MADLVCIGGAHIDIIARSRVGLKPETSNPGAITRQFGGVALNVATAAAEAGGNVALVGCVGDDSDGRSLKDYVTRVGIEDRLAVLEGGTTGHYVAVEDADGRLEIAVADLDMFEHGIDSVLETGLGMAGDARWWMVDANLPEQALARIARHPTRPLLAANTVSVPKARRLEALLGDIDMLFCNLDEASVLQPSAADPLAALGRAGIRQAVMTDGANPVRFLDNRRTGSVPVVAVSRGSVTGLGDTLAGTVLARMIAGDRLDDAVASGIAAARSRMMADTRHAS